MVAVCCVCYCNSRRDHRKEENQLKLHAFGLFLALTSVKQKDVEVAKFWAGGNCQSQFLKQWKQTFKSKQPNKAVILNIFGTCSENCTFS